MKKIKSFYKVFMATAFMLLLNGITFAQDSSASATTSTTTTSSSSTNTIQPWMWIVGGIIVLAIIIALVSRGSKEKIVVTKERTIE